MKLSKIICLIALALLFMNIVPDQAADNTGFTIARLKYSGGGDWYGNQSSLYNLLQFIKRNTNINVNTAEVRVDIANDELFNYPYLFMTGHGNIRFSDSEAARLRRYLTNGGFLHVDDNYGLDEAFRREMKKVFPHKDWVELPFDHEIFHIHFDFPRGIPKIHEHSGGPGKGLALFHEGKMIAFYSFNTDLSDGWEDQDIHNNPQHIREAALKMGVNIVVYVLTR
ncbi:MAG: DUF4159 domain-containing protein [bacterium]|nr:DUF4159 domain-containing protein [bacterium]